MPLHTQNDNILGRPIFLKLYFRPIVTLNSSGKTEGLDMLVGVPGAATDTYIFFGESRS